MQDKKGQDFSITTLILVILGVAVLVILILGFTQGCDKFGTWFGAKNNVEDISNQCNLACSSAQSGAKAGWCTVPRTVKDGTNTFTGVTCDKIKATYTSPTVKDKTDATKFAILAKVADACEGVTC